MLAPELEIPPGVELRGRKKLPLVVVRGWKILPLRLAGWKMLLLVAEVVADAWKILPRREG